MTIGIFTLCKNEAEWMGPWLSHTVPYVDQIVLFDGNSTDGTLEIIEHCQKTLKCGDRIRLVKNRDPKNLQADYVKTFNDCLKTVDCDWAWFLHPDMWVENPEQIKEFAKSGEIAAYVNIRSFAGNPGEQLYEIKGRAPAWKSIYRRKNPDLGLHYFGFYGAANEDCYFSEITGDEHAHYGEYFDNYPYLVTDSGINVLHFSDVRTPERRLDRMKKCLENQGGKPGVIDRLASSHPRVTLKDGEGFTFEPSDYPESFKWLSREFSKFHSKRLEVASV